MKRLAEGFLILAKTPETGSRMRNPSAAHHAQPRQSTSGTVFLLARFVWREVKLEQNDIAGVLHRSAAGEKEALDELVPVLYAQLRRLARQRLKAAGAERSLNTTGLVHEAYLRLIDSARATFNDRDHFLAIASRVMRNVLVDHARRRIAAKRGRGAALGELHEETWVTEVDRDRVTEVDEALTKLEQLDERQARMIEQRYFGGLTLEEIAATVDVSLATVKRDLRSARAWLAAELSGK
jgi:RNA polymerase sigma factor (TIGR02999 family)